MGIDIDSLVTEEKLSGLKSWATEENVPDLAPEDLPDVMGWKLLVRPLEPMRKSKGGIILTDGAQDEMRYLRNIGKVIAMGPLCYTEPRLGDVPWVEVGDYIIYGRNTGQNLTYRGIKYKLMSDSDPLLRVKDPEDVSPDQQFSGGWE